MNVRVEAGSLNISLKANIVEPTVKAKIKVIRGSFLSSTWTCFTLPLVSINGHSLSGINPKSVLAGGMATLAIA